MDFHCALSTNSVGLLLLIIIIIISSTRSSSSIIISPTLVYHTMFSWFGRICRLS